MPVTNLILRPRELGRIRCGERVETAAGKTRPARLDTFRLTCDDKLSLDVAATLWGGEVREWSAPGQPGDRYQLVIEAEELPCYVAPLELSQWYEHWSGGGCQRRCDGELAQIAASGGMVEQPCQCDPAARTCKLTTRLSVYLPDLPGVGVWRLETHSVCAAQELPLLVDPLVRAARRGEMIPCVLRLDRREKKEPGKPSSQFAVPVLDVRGVTLAALLSGAASRPAAPLQDDPAPALPDPGDDLRALSAQIEAAYERVTGQPARLPDGATAPAFRAHLNQFCGRPAQAPLKELSVDDRRRYLRAMEEHA